MDDIIGNKVQGSIDGTVKNGASLVAGKFGNAICTDGIRQYIDYGIHQRECFCNQDACAEGVTFSVWFKVHSVSASSVSAIDTGATSRSSSGVYMKYFPNRDIKLSIKWDQMYDYYTVPNFPLHTWIHLAFTWTRQNGIRGFINECDVDVSDSKGFASRTIRADPITETSRFTVGAGRSGTLGFGRMSLDELIAWNNVLEPAEIWQLFIQGGTMQTVP